MAEVQARRSRSIRNMSFDSFVKDEAKKQAKELLYQGLRSGTRSHLRTHSPWGHPRNQTPHIRSLGSWQQMVPHDRRVRSGFESGDCQALCDSQERASTLRRWDKRVNGTQSPSTPSRVASRGRGKKDDPKLTCFVWIPLVFYEALQRGDVAFGPSTLATIETSKWAPPRSCGNHMIQLMSKGTTYLFLLSIAVGEVVCELPRHADLYH